MSTHDVSPGSTAGQLKRSVGFYGLMFVSLGSIIGSGWLLGALNAAEVAGPASVLSWILAAGMLSLLALTYAELGAAYPVAGGGGRFPYYSHGPIAGFTAGWASWLQAVFIAPIEVLAAIAYVNSVGWVNTHFNMINKTGASAGLLNGHGLAVAVALMVIFTAMNLAGAKFLSDSNIIVVVWKTAVPFLAVGVVAALRFIPENFHAGGGFLPFGFHGVFAALTGGVVFALQGFEQAVQLAGEARNPKRDLSRAILTAMAIGAVLYALLQIVMIGALEPAQHRERMVAAARHRSVRLRRVVHPRARAGRWMARQRAPRRRGHFTGRHRRRLRGDVGSSFVRAWRRARDAGLSGENEQRRRAGRVDPGRSRGRHAGVWPVQELECARFRCDRRNSDHVRVRSGVAGGAPSGRWRPTALVSRARARADAPRRVLLRQSDHVLGRVSRQPGS